MAKFIVQYMIDGEAEFEAETAEEAQAQFERMSPQQLVDEGNLFADDAKTPEQIKQEIAEFAPAKAVTHDRDVNVARNIARLGRETLAEGAPS